MGSAIVYSIVMQHQHPPTFAHEMIGIAVISFILLVPGLIGIMLEKK